MIEMNFKILNSFKLDLAVIVNESRNLTYFLERSLNFQQPHQNPL